MGNKVIGSWGDFIHIYEGVNLKKVLEWLDRISKVWLGDRVLKRIKAKAPVNIQYSEGSFAFSAKGAGYGARGSLRIYADFRKLENITDPTRPMVKDLDVEYVYLYHELVHALRYEAGQFVESEDSFAEVLAGTGESAVEEEWPVVGLYEYGDYLISENQFRRQIRLRKGIPVPRRPYYFTKKKSPKGFKKEIVRRMLLRLPDEPRPRKDELKFGRNPFNRTLRKREVREYQTTGLSHRDWRWELRKFHDERKIYPRGYPRDFAVNEHEWGPSRLVAPSAAEGTGISSIRQLTSNRLVAPPVTGGTGIWSTGHMKRPRMAPGQQRRRHGAARRGR
jgi:hypothetical protein